MIKELTWEQIRKSLEHLKYSRFSEAVEIIKKELGFDDIPKEDYEEKKSFTKDYEAKTSKESLDI